ncbi:hypothetical protein BDU57DRAFT_326852 [Ampelomyces quisqualis]|uniref:Uncharacterized protein n=1 Tax=Ampelomyces quisqualis TaxID=50730 RepID=A0A6A5QEP6_AMPQU|nr:hypothetical protein BDU57DRAFT_326852 [Ampelomyces quisqualis]
MGSPARLAFLVLTPRTGGGAIWRDVGVNWYDKTLFSALTVKANRFRAPQPPLPVTNNTYNTDQACAHRVHCQWLRNLLVLLRRICAMDDEATRRPNLLRRIRGSASLGFHHQASQLIKRLHKYSCTQTTVPASLTASAAPKSPFYPRRRSIPRSSSCV